MTRPCVLVFAGLLPWTLFSSVLNEASNSVISNSNLVSPNWVPVVTNMGDGNLKEFIQTVTPGGPRYYRLRVLP